MSIINEIAQAHADHDPHGFKKQGLGDPSKLHSFVNAPYEHQKFPLHVHKDGKTIIVKDEGALEAAKAEGWSETAPDRSFSE